MTRIFRLVPWGGGSLLLGILFSISSLSGVLGQSESKEDAFVRKGRALYVQYCVSCHGPAGLGDGPVSHALKHPLPDLSRIGQRHDGFPTERVMVLIDGERTVSAHGTREMPVWGKRFRRETGSEARAMADVLSLVKYLESIQQ